ncbi:hypothetical protein [Actinacidiphila acididurans]|uniref:HK97 gp10 family phage protein n=1 Tax=Actinacidiphila acididurans TaxID=2784346 RepID=A0ABS2U329_9ACTN|nr:hypothetical protein [Actinacidiphila acididurans]MBM9509995.1 hypothetical protein [Actinacidiphila acididurans]
MDVGISVDGVEEWAAAVDALGQRMQSATRAATRDAMKIVQRGAFSRLSRYYHPPGTPTPAPPGGPPARINGHLRGSLSPTGPRPTGTGYTGQLGPTAVYSRIQELGGQAGRNHSVTIPPRPYLAPTVRDARDAIRRQYVAAWARAMP